MKYAKLTLITLAAALMTACGQKDNSTATTGQDVQKAAPVVSVVTAQAEDVDITNYLLDKQKDILSLCIMSICLEISFS